MSESIGLRVDGRAVSAERGITIAAALENAGQRSFRRSVTGAERGVLCAMGICFECRVSIDRVPHRRACMEVCREGMEIETGGEAVGIPSSSAASAVPAEARVCEVAVVGGGPAGIAAGCRAAEAGAATLILDEGLSPGGQIYRHLPGRARPEGVSAWIDRLARSGAVLLGGATVFDARTDGDAFRLDVASAKARLTVAARTVVLATGARELYLPFPGWTLPGVYGAGGVQALWKSGASMRGRIAVVAGSGPLLLPVAASLTKAGADVRIVAEQAGLTALSVFAAGLLRHPEKLVEAVRYRRAFAAAAYRTGWWIAEALGRQRLERVVLSDGNETLELPCDLAAVAYGLVPNTELARLAGCRIADGAVSVDARQESSISGLFCAGEPCGVAGFEVALAEGELAGLAAAGRLVASSAEGRRLAAVRSRGRRLARAMAETFRPRTELRRMARQETIVCRCEDVPRDRIAACASVREAKLFTRAGMGPCQGRVCGPAMSFLFGWDSDTVRPPIEPVALGSLITEEAPV